jgi:hypothetical protein
VLCTTPTSESKELSLHNVRSRRISWDYYRLKFPYKSGNPATDEQVKNGLSYVDQK